MRAAKQPPELRPTNRRIESFSDAVFAIAVTIMVLEIRVPDRLAFADDAVAFQEFVTLLGIYVLSFVVVGILWANHHYLVFTLPSTDRAKASEARSRHPPPTYPAFHGERNAGGASSRSGAGCVGPCRVARGCVGADRQPLGRAHT